MNIIKLITALGLGALVSACGATDIATRNAPFETVPVAPISSPAPRSNFIESTGTFPAIAPNILNKISVSGINVVVPLSLKVSEANRYYPRGDIVWREDPIGNRHAQVKAIFDAAMATGTAPLNGPVPVTIDIVVERFHALTEKARYTIGGVHSIRFRMVIRDAQSGLPLAEPRVIQADLDAFGGQQAINAEARGQTQKVRISGHLAEVIRQELSRPEGYKNAHLGFYQQINKF